MSSVAILAKNLAGRISENSPTILTGLAVAGVISTTVLAVKVTPKALQLIEQEGDRLGYVPTAKDILRVSWRVYIPPIAVATATIGCIVGANQVSMRRNAALAGLYAITDRAFQEYQTKVVETMGANRELKVRDEIAADRIKAHPPGPNEIIFTGKGDVLCYDSLTGRYFKSSVEHIRQTMNEVNKNLMSEMFIPLNEFFYELGLGYTDLGNELGWSIEKGLIDIQFSTQLSENKEPCLVLNYSVFPRFVK